MMLIFSRDFHINAREIQKRFQDVINVPTFKSYLESFLEPAACRRGDKDLPASLQLENHSLDLREIGLVFIIALIGLALVWIVCLASFGIAILLLDRSRKACLNFEMNGDYEGSITYWGASHLALRLEDSRRCITVP
ncbi:hypothetical protein Ciccas_001685, partial [Cichlidogyrus casuarinus]